jgi:hypothetical protein
VVPAPAPTRLFGSAVRILFGLIWLVDVYFKWQPSFLQGIATDIGTAIIYAVVFLALVALDARGKGTRPYSLHAVIERRLPWWRRLAEVRR